MSVIEDSRKVLQDFIAPELRAIDARLSALEKRFDSLEQRTDKRFDQLEQHVDKRFDQMMFEIRRLTDFHEMELRLARVETELKRSKSSPPDGPSSEAA